MPTVWPSLTSAAPYGRRPGSAATIVLAILLTVVLTAFLVIGVLYLSGVFTVVVQAVDKSGHAFDPATPDGKLPI